MVSTPPEPCPAPVLRLARPDHRRLLVVALSLVGTLIVLVSPPLPALAATRDDVRTRADILACDEPGQPIGLRVLLRARRRQDLACDDRSGHVVDTSKAPTAFDASSATGVEIRGLVVETFANPASSPAFNSVPRGSPYATRSD
jgi:hypothetical protein